jgi:hypothetical protein
LPLKNALKEAKMKSLIFTVLIFYAQIVPAVQLQLTEDEERECSGLIDPRRFLCDWGYEGWLRTEVTKTQDSLQSRKFRLRSGKDIRIVYGAYQEEGINKICSMTSLSQLYGQEVTLHFASCAPLIRRAIYTQKEHTFNHYIVTDVIIYHTYPSQLLWNLLGGKGESWPEHIVIRYFKPQDPNNPTAKQDTFAIFMKNMALDQPDCFDEELLAFFRFGIIVL